MKTNTPSPINSDAENKPFPKYESHCHGAPVKVMYGKVKYYCTECGEPCIARQKK